MLELQKRDAEALGQLAPEAIAALYQPSYKFRVSHQKSASHTPFCGTGVGFTLYVLSGSCTVAPDWTSRPILLRAREFCRVPRGGHVMAFPEPTEYIKVLELPEEIWSQHEAAQQTVAADRREDAAPAER